MLVFEILQQLKMLYFYEIANDSFHFFNLKANTNQYFNIISNYLL